MSKIDLVVSTQKKSSPSHELEVFIETMEKENDFVNQELIKQNCTIFERALFNAIFKLDYLRVKELIALQVNLNLTVTIPKPPYISTHRYSIQTLTINPISYVLMTAETNSAGKPFSPLMIESVSNIIKALVEADACFYDTSFQKYLSPWASRWSHDIKFSTDVLSQLIICILDNPTLVSTFELILNRLKSQKIPYNFEYILRYILSDVSERFSNVKKNLPMEVIKNIIAMLISTGNINYATKHEDKILDITLHLMEKINGLVRALKTTFYNDLSRALNNVMDDIVKKALEYSSNVKENVDVLSCLVYYSQEELSQTHDLKKSITRDFEPKRIAFIKKNVVAPAMQKIKESYAYGLILARHRNAYRIPIELWNIIKSYLSNLAFVDHAYQFASHIDVPENTTTDMLCQTISSTQIVSQRFEDVIRHIEKSENYKKEMAEIDCQYNYLYIGFITPRSSNEDALNNGRTAYYKMLYANYPYGLTSYNPTNNPASLPTEGPYCFPIDINASLQPNCTIITHFNIQRKPDVNAYLTLFKDGEGKELTLRNEKRYQF